MFSLFLVTSLLLPGLLDACCFPLKVSYVSVIAGEGTISDNVYVDYTLNKYVIMPEGGTKEYILTQMDEDRTYTRYRNGKCTYQPDVFPMIRCMHHWNTRTRATVAGVEVEALTFSMEIENNDDQKHHKVTSSTAVVTKDGCLPIMATQTGPEGVRTQVFYNVTTSVPDIGAFKHDLSDCVELV